MIKKYMRISLLWIVLGMITVILKTLVYIYLLKRNIDFKNLNIDIIVYPLAFAVVGIFIEKKEQKKKKSE